MTTKRDWVFRADHMRLHATVLEKRAEAIKHEAFLYRCRADTCQVVADSMPDDPPIVVPPRN